MLILPISTPLLQKNDDLASIIVKRWMLKPSDIVVISSKAIATIEGAAMSLSTVSTSERAQELGKACHQDPRFAQLILNETKRMNGSIEGTCPFAILTSLRPTGMHRGRILCPNAGLDQSNIVDGYAIGWPKDPVASARRLRQQLRKALGQSKKSRESTDRSHSLLSSIPLHANHSSQATTTSDSSSPRIIISDSCCRPGRLGVTAFALVCAGIDPFKSEIGSPDLFGKKLRVTNEAIADQLATAANAVMGNAGQSIPAAIIRNFELPSSNFCGWVDGIEPQEDLFCLAPSGCWKIENHPNV